VNATYESGMKAVYSPSAREVKRGEAAHPHPRMETRPVSKTLYSLVYQTMGKSENQVILITHHQTH
jgi:hypothetical protein